MSFIETLTALNIPKAFSYLGEEPTTEEEFKDGFKYIDEETGELYTPTEFPISWTTLEQELKVSKNNTLRKKVSIEASKRINKGVITKGKPFKTDDSTTQKLKELVDGFDDGDVPDNGIKIKTEAGETVEYRTREETDFIRRVANIYRMNVTRVSEELQSMASIPEDCTNDIYWPQYKDLF